MIQRTCPAHRAQSQESLLLVPAATLLFPSSNTALLRLLFTIESLYSQANNPPPGARTFIMSGIPVYTSSPIKPTKAYGTTPQTAAPAYQGSPLAPSTVPTSTSSASASSSSYPPAQPGAAAMPAPTVAAQRYAPLPPPTPTTTTDDLGPPQPQPGAVPIPPSRSTVAPPPMAGESYHQTTAPTSSVFPPQMGYAPPTMTYGSQPPKSSTSTTNTSSMPYPVAISSPGNGTLEHPPGYHQDVYAAELTSDQRRAHEDAEANNSSGFGVPNTGSSNGFEPEGVWNTAKKWAQQAGEKIQATEADVWKKINNE